MNGDKQEVLPQILKCREDPNPVLLVPSEKADDDGALVLQEGSSCSWLDGSETVSTDKLRKRIEPWLTALCQSEHLSVLLGSGLTHALHGMAAGVSLPGMNKADFGECKYAALIEEEAKRTAFAAGRHNGNIEDQIRVAGELTRGLEILGTGQDEADAREAAEGLRTASNRIIKEFASSILEGERGIVTAAEDRRNLAFNYLVTFLMSFAARSGTRDRLQIFTTNYDRLVEAGADAAGLHLLDRFQGALAPIFRSSRLDLDMHYNPPGIRGEPRYLEGVARFTKLHGSVDWIDFEGAIRRIGLPLGATEVEPYLDAPGMAGVDPLSLMIHPNAAKDRETAGFPYVELFRDFAAASCRPNHTLFTFGYSFGDEHINRVIEDMLTIPSTHLVVISFGDPLNRIMESYSRIGRPAQCSLLVGDHLGDLRTLVDHYLPKPAIDRTTFRMAELLKARWGAAEHPAQGNSTDSGNGDGDGGQS